MRLRENSVNLTLKLHRSRTNLDGWGYNKE